MITKEMNMFTFLNHMRFPVKSGLMAGDKILEVNNISVKGKVQRK